MKLVPHIWLQILYHILNSHADIAAERVFAPGVDMEAHLRDLNYLFFPWSPMNPQSF